MSGYLDLQHADPIASVDIEGIAGDTAFAELLLMIVEKEHPRAGLASKDVDLMTASGHRLAPWTIRRMRARLLVPVAAIAALVALVLAAVVSQSPNPLHPTPVSDLGMKITSFESATPRLLDSSLSFSDLPDGFHLVSDREINRLVAGGRSSFQRVVVYRGTGARAGDQLVLELSQRHVAAANVVPGGQYVMPASSSSTRPSRQPTTIDGVPGSIISDPGASDLFLDGPVGADEAAPGVPSSLAKPDTAVFWDTPDSDFYVRGQGTTESEVLAFANGIIYQPGDDSCLGEEGISRTTGLCSPGEFTSPRGLPPLLPPHSQPVGHGTLHGVGWALAVQRLGRLHVVEFFYGAESGSLDPILVPPRSGDARFGFPVYGTNTPLPKGEVGLLGVTTTLGGDRFAFGVTDPSVTAVESRSASRARVSVPVLDKHVDGKAYFVLYLGKSAGPTNPVPEFCAHGRVAITLFAGSSSVATVHLAGDTFANVLRGNSLQAKCF